MRILQIITLGHELYGAQKHVLDLSELLVQNGHEVLVLTGTEGTMTDALNQKNIPCERVASLRRSVNPYYDIKSVRDISKKIKAFNPDLIATHSSKAGIVGRLAAWLNRKPNVFTAHGWSFEEGIPFVRRKTFLMIEKIIGKMTSKIITVANLEKDYAIKCKVVEPEKMSTIYYGVANTDLSENQVKNDRFTMVMVAGLRPQKDHETLVKALSQLTSKEWQIYFLGDGELTPQIQALVAEKGLSDRVKFEGMVNNVKDYLSKAHLMVLSTNWEGLPISILEGLSSGLPVVATDVAGVKEEVVDGYNGITVPHKSIDALKEAIDKCLDNPDMLVTYGENSRRLFEKEFTLDSMYQKTINLYKEITNNG